MKNPTGKSMRFGILAIVLYVSATCTPVLSSSCLECHEAAKFQDRVIHAPVKEGKCEHCHNPHVAKYPGLLRKPEAQLCYGCHVPFKEKSSLSKFLHQPVREGKCVVCHAAHAAGNPGLIRKKGGEGCLDCHEKSKKTYVYTHAPYAKGQCGACHDPHRSSDYRLLKVVDPELCLGCHKETPALKKIHLGKDLGEMSCVPCHNPHGGEGRSLVRPVRHAPFAKGDCRVCHEQPELLVGCIGCHKAAMTSFYKNYAHIQGNGRVNPCRKCHSPHAADSKGLLKGSGGEVCRSCHHDTFKRRDKMLHKHSGWNTCTDCHTIHGSDQIAMLKDKTNKMCVKCHKRHVKFTHPIGDKAIDPRNSQPMTCITCHDPCGGTMFKHQLRGSGERGLCIQCHQGY